MLDLVEKQIQEEGLELKGHVEVVGALGRAAEADQKFMPEHSAAAAAADVRGGETTVKEEKKPSTSAWPTEASEENS